jgi:hypothetical protein
MSERQRRTGRRLAPSRAISVLVADPHAGVVPLLGARSARSELTIEAFLKPERLTLKLLIRVPLSGLMGFSLPKEGIGYLALGPDPIPPCARLLGNWPRASTSTKTATGCRRRASCEPRCVAVRRLIRVV